MLTYLGRLFSGYVDFAYGWGWSWIGAALFLSVAWALLGRLVVRDLTGPRNRLLLLGPTMLVLGVLLLPIGILVPAVAFDAVRSLLSPDYFWLALVVFAAVWAFCRSRHSRIARAISKTLQPWLIAMTAVAVVYSVARYSLPRSDWKWLFRLEVTASWCEWTLNDILPHSLWASVAVSCLFFFLSVRKPQWTAWSSRVEGALGQAQTAAAALAVFTSFTFFGSGQAGAFIHATAEEKFARLEKESTAVADLLLASRIAENTEDEKTAATKYLDVIYAGVIIDIRMPIRLDEYPVSEKFTYKEWYRERVRAMVERRVGELSAYIGRARYDKSPRPAGDGLKSLMQRRLTPEEIADARTRFDKSIVDLLHSAGDFALHPLSLVLDRAGDAGIVKSLVENLYATEAADLAHDLSGPLADALFGKDKRSAHAVVEAAPLVARTTFDPDVVPTNVRTPTLESRFSEEEDERIVREAIEEGRGKE